MGGGGVGLGVGLIGGGGGGGRRLGRGKGWGGVVGVGLQHGPYQVLSLLLCLDVLKPEHLIWSHSLQPEHSTDVEASILVHTGQNQGPGFCSIPALIRRSRMRLAGSSFFVKDIKNTVLRIAHCHI